MSEYVHYVPQEKKTFTPRLESLTIELTERCHNDCIHCCINLPADDDAARRREMTTAQIKDVIRQAADLGCLQLHLTGGEPLLRPDFEALYIYARRLGLPVLLFTNGRPLTTRLADLFARIPPLADIEITVYGMHPESYEAVTRAPGSFAQFMRGVRLLWEREVPFVVKSALLPPNRHEMDEFESGPPGMPWKVTKPAYSMEFDLRSRRDNGHSAGAAKNRLIASLRTPPRESINVVMRDSARYHPWTEELAEEKLQPPGDRLFNCGACEGKTVCVDAYGVAQPCMGLRAPEMTYDLFGIDQGEGRSGKQVEPTNAQTGNVRNRLSHALDHFTRLRELRATNPQYLRRCARCYLKGVCQQCPAKSWTEHGSYDTPVEHLCETAHTWARYLGWLDEDERGWEIEGWRGRLAK